MLQFLVVSALVQFALGQATSNTQVMVTSDYRSITFKLKPGVTNKTLDLMVTKGNMNVSSSSPFKANESIVVQNMPLNAYVYYTLMDKKLYKVARTKDSSSVSVTVKPGKPKNIRRCLNEICWQTPDNIMTASDNDKSIEYHVSVCNYNQLTMENTNCMMKGVVVDSYLVFNNNNQTTGAWSSGSKTTFVNKTRYLNEEFYNPLNMGGLDKNRDLAYVIKSVGLNGGKDGESDQVVIRFNPANEPAKLEVRAIMPYDKGIFLTWKQPDSSLGDNITYRIEYKKETADKFINLPFKKIGAAWPNDTDLVANYAININKENGANLEAQTTYVIRFGISESKHGSSKWTMTKVKTDEISSATGLAASTFLLLASWIVYNIFSTN